MSKVECKVFFPLGTTKEIASSILNDYKDVQLFNFYDDIAIGSNNVCFAVIEINTDSFGDLQSDERISKIELIDNLRNF